MNPLIQSITYAFKAAQVKRYHTRYTLKEETVGHHSHGVASILAILHPNAKGQLLRAAILHDLEEWESGDMPAPTKRELGLQKVFRDYGDVVRNRYHIPMPALSFWEEVRLKFADNLQGALFALWEIEAGNSHVLETLGNYISYMEELKEELEESELMMLEHVRTKAQDFLVFGRE